MADHLHHHQAKRRSLGCHFHPTHREVIKYLVGFATDEPLPGQDEVMQLVDVYAEKDPWQIVEGNTGYFITPLKKKKDHHIRWKRGVGDNGTWKSQDSQKQVFDHKGRLIGYVHHLKYTPASSKPCSSIIKELFGEWLMTEYSLYTGDINKKIINTDFAICKIKKKKQKKSKNQDKDMTMSETEVTKFINSVLHEEKTDHDQLDATNNINLEDYEFV